MADPKFDIPKEDFESLIELVNLGDEEFKSISEKILALNNLDRFDDIKSALSEITSHYNVILNLVFTLCALDIKEEQFVADLFSYYTANIKKIEKQLDEEIFKNRFLSFFTKKSPIRLAAKSLLLSFEVDHIYRDARILTDIRPVFSNKDDLDLLGNITINQLRISYRRKNKVDNFFVSLDNEDLENLKNVIERAINKTKILKEIKLNKSHE